VTSDIEPCNYCGAAVQQYQGRVVRVTRDVNCEANPHSGLHEVAEWETTAVSERWRVGRKVGRTIYLQRGPEPSDDDPLIGVMDTARLARTAVEAVNAMQKPDPHQYRYVCRRVDLM